MKKTNLVYLLSTLILFSMFIATSCEKDDDITPITSVPENPMFRNKINEIRSYIGMSNEEFNSIMMDSYGLEERVFYYSNGDKQSFYYHEITTFQFTVDFNTFTDKVYGVTLYHFLDYDTLISYYEGYSKVLYNTMPQSYYYIGGMYCNDGLEYETSNREEFQNKFQIKKDRLLVCYEGYSDDRLVNSLVYSDSLNNFAQDWASFTFADRDLMPIFP
ncbi:MAG: hypothetical protein WC984_00295 [Bacteroidales bacterium]